MTNSIIRRILVPTDFSEPSDTALEYARTLAGRVGASLHLLHVLEDPFLAEGLLAEAYIGSGPSVRVDLLDDARERLLHRAAGATTEVIFGHGATTIVEYAERGGFDLIVMGTHGRTGLAHLLIGSVAETVVRTATVPVLTVGRVTEAARAPHFVEKAIEQPA